jgi:hypothetical protein
MEQHQKRLKCFRKTYNQKNAQQSMHLTLGSLRQSQAFFYALSFFWLDGFATPALVVEPVIT